MMTRAGGHYGAPFRGESGFAQGNPLLPTILNVVVDVVIRHWEYLVEEQEEVDSSSDKGYVEQTAGLTIRDQDDGLRQTEEGHQQLTAKAEFFYADDGMIVHTDPGWLKSAFDMLTCIFDRLGI